ncbi:MAG: phage tail sheath family protein, partial [Symbiobacteriaceae bacterium]|nr:phage tail sheath family protein [Symbiobacteriaceae bacterium]
FGEDSPNPGFDKPTSDEITQEGITTAIFFGGRWVLWGDHTAAYSFGADVDARAIFDVSMRMLFHIANSFQREWGLTIDKPMNRSLLDRILNREQEKLDSYVTAGGLIGNPTISFLEEKNSTAEMLNGQFRWDTQATPTPPLKAATLWVSYSDAGFRVFFE